jgi:hypothetical protein
MTRRKPVGPLVLLALFLLPLAAVGQVEEARVRVDGMV